MRFLRWLWWFIRYIFSPLDPASAVVDLTIEVDEMKNATFTWTLPTTRVQGGPLDPNDIEGTEISLRVVGIPDWTVLGVVQGTGQEFVQNELDIGDYEARAVVLTTDPQDSLNPPQRGEPTVLPFVVADDSPAAAVEGFSVELS